MDVLIDGHPLSVQARLAGVRPHTLVAKAAYTSCLRSHTLVALDGRPQTLVA